MLGHNYTQRMARRPNASPGERFPVTISQQSVKLLRELARRGVFGRTPAEVGGRFIEEALQRFVEVPKFDLDVLTASRDRD